MKQRKPNHVPHSQGFRRQSPLNNLQWLKCRSGMENGAPTPSKDNILTQKFQWAFSFQLSEKSSPINRYSTAGREVSGIWQSKVCTPAFPPSRLVVEQLLFPLRESPEPETPKSPSGPKTINSSPPMHSNYTAIITNFPSVCP